MGVETPKLGYKEPPEPFLHGEVAFPIAPPKKNNKNEGRKARGPAPGLGGMAG